MRTPGFALAILTLSFAPSLAAAQESRQAETNNAPDTARSIASQPAKDVGAVKQDIPPVLMIASSNPYSRKSTGSCGEIKRSIAALNDVLGPDFKVGAEQNENRLGKVAEAGGKTIVNSIIPFRGLVREVTGAAPAQRRLNAAIDAGYARRGFLKGAAAFKGCRG